MPFLSVQTHPYPISIHQTFLKSETNELSDATSIITPGAVVNFGKPGTALDLKLKA